MPVKPEGVSSSGRVKLEDKRFDANVATAKFLNHFFLRLVAKERHFQNVDFRYCIFDACYLRDCTFDSCDFTGCRFIGTNFHGSSFPGCKFEYAVFERTDIDDDVLANNCPGYENLKRKFARTLRMNYQQLGDSESVNKAISVELEATNAYLYKSWRSNERYYRKKYKEWVRVGQFFKWANFKALDWIWGNGESAYKLGRAALFVLAAIAVIDATVFRDAGQVQSYAKAILVSPQILLGVEVPEAYGASYLSVIVFTRLVLFGFFMSIVIKRFNRR